MQIVSIEKNISLLSAETARSVVSINTYKIETSPFYYLLMCLKYC